MGIYLKGIALGLLTGLIAVVLLAAALLRLSGGEGVAAASVVIDSFSMLVAAVFGFALGFWWVLHRSRRRRTTER